MSRFIFLTATNKAIAVNVNETDVGKAYNATELVEVLKNHNVTAEDAFATSSTVDFATEHGFPTNTAARVLIEEAFTTLHKNGLFG